MDGFSFFDSPGEIPNKYKIQKFNKYFPKPEFRLQ
jgi:hypothetical protein